jgi:hypothetical protein
MVVVTLLGWVVSFDERCWTERVHGVSAARLADVNRP